MPEFRLRGALELQGYSYDLLLALGDLGGAWGYGVGGLSLRPVDNRLKLLHSARTRSSEQPSTPSSIARRELA